MRIEKDYYYRGSWLRHVGNIERGRVWLADFTGIGSVSIEHMQRWAKERYTVEEAKLKFPDEVAEIEKAKAWVPGAGLPPWQK